MHSNKKGLPEGNPRRQPLDYLRSWATRHGRTVRDQMLRGAAYGVGSGAVSLLLIWWQGRR
ncbi:hypothetical protein ACFZDJ_04510 [Streptomyces sp. NPDC007896]|uniref:hypothetical protein n=1 Tax=Streptomyces sp. NPDC007896 TaxID=3364784 RepID=UPI0036ED561D